jgi:uncharacterized protein (TIGR03435 family)
MAVDPVSSGGSWLLTSHQGASFNPDESTPTFNEALKELLGIKMVSKKGPMEFFVAAHVEHPSAN